MDKGNIWENGSFNNLSFDEAVEKYIQYQPKENATKEEVKNFKSKDNGENFSWVLDSDSKCLKINDDNRSVAWGIPNQVIGNPDTAIVFLCLLNPRTRNDTLGIGKLKDYIDAEDKNGGEFFRTINEYKEHINNNGKENILKQEVSKMLNRKLGPQEIIKIIDGLKDKIYPKNSNEDFKKPDQFGKTWRTYQKKFELSTAFKIKLDKSFDEFIENETVNHRANLQNLIYQNLKDDIREEQHKWVDIWNKKFEEMKESELNNPSSQNPLFERFIKKIGDELDPINEMYYFKTYYWNLIINDKFLNKEDFFEHLYNEGKNKEKILEFYEGLKICDLELFPYRTNNNDGIKFKNKKSYKDLESSKYVASLIIKRIKKYENDKINKPIFIFRSYAEWRNVMYEYYLLTEKSDGNDKSSSDIEGMKNTAIINKLIYNKKELNYEKQKELSKFNELINLKKKFLEFEKEYFYKFANQNGLISRRNIHKVIIDKSDFEDIRKLSGITEKES